MGRPYQIFEKPIMVPYVCIQCGVGSGSDREWFVDLGFYSDQYFDVGNAAIYLCNECYHGMTLDIGRLLNKFRSEHEKWEEGEQPSYEWMEANVKWKEDLSDVREPESGITNGGNSEAELLDAGIAASSDRDDQDSEPNDPEPESSDSGDAESTDDSDSNAGTGLKINFGTSS